MSVLRGMGPLRALTDAAGAVVQTYQPDEFGVSSQVQGQSTQRLQYTGEERDANGFVNLRARVYDPALGRFLQRDPAIGDPTLPLSRNRYAYAGNNPVSATDPSGLRTYFIGGIGGNDPTYAPFVQRLAGYLTDVRGPVTPYGACCGALGLVEDARTATLRNLQPDQDTDAQAFAAMVKRDLAAQPLAPGEQLNFIGYSGGATTAFNAAALLQTKGITIDNVLTLGGYILRGKPGNVIKWTFIAGNIDVFSETLAPPDEYHELWGVGHYPGYLKPSNAQLIKDLILGAGLR